MARVLTIDLHTHLHEKEIHPASYWKEVKKKKLDAVAITEHYNFRPGKAFERLMEEKPKKVVLIPGIELSTEIGHALVLSKDTRIYEEKGFFEKNLSLKKALELAEKNNALLVISHPWGFGQDSAGFIIGEKKLREIVEREKIGVEAFNGMIGHLSNFVYGSKWVQKPLNFFDFLEKNRVARKTFLDKLGKKMKTVIEKKSYEIIERAGKTMELANNADFLTAGSDAHSAERIGTGVLKLKFNGKRVDAESILKALQEKENVVWAGPFVKEIEKGKYLPIKTKVSRTEILQAINYATRKVTTKKVRGLGSTVKKKAIGKKFNKLRKKLKRKKKGKK